MATIKLPGITMVDPANTEQVRDSFLLIAHFNRGKSFLAADAIRYYQARGKECLYMVTPGESPDRSISQHGMGEVMFRVTKLGDVEAVTKAIKGKVDVLAVDSANGLQRLVMDLLVGPAKTPDDYKLWVPTHDRFRKVIADMINAVQVLIMTCPAEMSADTFLTPRVEGQKAPKATIIAAELEGKQTTKVAGLFQQVGYLETTVNNVRPLPGSTVQPGKEVIRTIRFDPDERTICRTNGLLRPILDPIVLPDGLGGWDAIMDVFDAHRKPLEESS